jgi:diguanylate cyclase (GGDEF)-like protein
MRLITSTPGWAIGTVGLLLALLIGITTVALLGTREQKSAAESLEAASLYAGALEASRADFVSANAAMVAVALNAALTAAESKSDQNYLVNYSQTLDQAREDLAQARATALSRGRDTDVALVDDFIARVNSYDQEVQSLVAVYLTEGVEKAAQAQDERAASALELMDDLKVAIDREQALLSAERASAVETSDRSFLTQLILGAFALVAATAAGGTLVVGTRQLVLSIEQRKRAEDRIRHLAYHDALTDLPNRSLMEDHLVKSLTQARRKGRMLALLYLDLDRFKRINEGVGHTLGDQVLQRVAERLTSTVREADTIARVGGDEFTVLLPKISRVEDAAQVAERILEGLRHPLVLDGSQLHTTTSIGVAFYPNDAEEADTLLRYADIAMYHAKEQGRDNYQFYNPGMKVPIPDPLALESDLRCALERDEFVVYYQPQVDISCQQIVGVEALVRWQHPSRGLMLPADFIPVAEESGLIVPLGEWVLRTACAQAKAWQEAALPAIRLAVNVSARQFQQRDLAEMVDRALKETSLEPHCLQLEITESVVMHDMDFAIATLANLKAMGIQIAIDDFGCGHSSLNYLKRLPIDHVKIDQSFVRDLATDPSDAAIVGSVVAMTRELNLKVVAEGVETEEQLAFLKDRRCDVVQGFLFSKPMPADAVEKMIAPGTRLQLTSSGHKVAWSG